MITQEEVRHLFDYDSETGHLLWKNPSSKRFKKGSVVGRLNNNGMACVCVKGRTHLVHKIIWLWFNGYYPDFNFLFKNGKRHDTRIENLSEKNGFCDVINDCYFHGNTDYFQKGGRWQAILKKDKIYSGLTEHEFIGIGFYSTPTEAAFGCLYVEQCLGLDYENSNAFKMLKANGYNIK